MFTVIFELNSPDVYKTFTDVADFATQHNLDIPTYSSNPLVVSADFVLLADSKTLEATVVYNSAEDRIAHKAEINENPSACGVDRTAVMTYYVQDDTRF